MVAPAISRVNEKTMNNYYSVLWEKSRSTANGADHGARFIAFF